jgi:hypothetical protein
LVFWLTHYYDIRRIHAAFAAQTETLRKEETLP